MAHENVRTVQVGPEQAERESALTRHVIESFAATESPRLRQLMTSLVTHLHAFARENRLTETEWRRAVDFLTAAGRITDDKRQEFILLSDVLGLSMQTVAINNEAEGDATEATVFGPFHVDGAPQIEQGGDMAFGARGTPLWAHGSVRGTGGAPVPGARIEVWECDGDGFYDVQYGNDRMACRAHLFSDAAGEYRFWGLKPVPYPIQHDGPVGTMLDAARRSPMRAAHLHFMVTAPGYRRLVTHIFVAGCEYLATDTVFGVKQSLIKEFEDQPAGTPTPDGRELAAGWSQVRFDIVLAPEHPPVDPDARVVVEQEPGAGSRPGVRAQGGVERVDQ